MAWHRTFNLWALILRIFIWGVLGGLILIAWSGADLQMGLYRLLWGTFNGGWFFDIAMHWVEPARSISHAPFGQPLFGWPALMVCLAVFGTRCRYRRAGPVALVALVSLFGYFLCVLGFEVALLAFDLRHRHTWLAGSPHSVVVVVACNLVAAFAVWRWTRSRLMFAGLIVLSAMAPLQMAALYGSPYFRRSIVSQSHGNGMTQIMPSRFEEWAGPEITETWLNDALHWALSSRGPLFYEQSYPIAWDEEMDYDVSGNASIYRYPTVHVRLNIPFALTYNAGVLVLAVVARRRTSVWLRHRCEGCGYDIRGLPLLAPCPECGLERPPESRERPLPV